MRKMITLIFTMIVSGMSFAECSQFPQTDGEVVRQVDLYGTQVTMKAQFSKSMGVYEWNHGRLYTLHLYDNFEFFANGRSINITPAVAVEFFKELGYSHLSWKVLQVAGLLNIKPILDENFVLRRTSSGDYILQKGTGIIPYHPVCSSWVY